jgi:hypothetical protein
VCDACLFPATRERGPLLDEDAGAVRHGVEVSR